MKAIFFIFVISFIKCLNELAEQKKRENYLIKMFKNKIVHSNVYYDFLDEGKMVLKAKTTISDSKSAILIPPEYIFSDSINLFI